MKSLRMVESRINKEAADAARNEILLSRAEGRKIMIEELRQKYDDLAARAAELRRFL